MRDAIRSGIYPRGSQLPSTRDLAAQFGINRNTANKIYHELADDQLIELAVNRPPVVIGDGKAAPEDVFYQRVRATLQTLLMESRLIGLSSADMTRMLSDIAFEFFASYRMPRIYVAECNEIEARAYAQELTIRLETVVRPILLGQLGKVEPDDIVVTPFFHLNEVRDEIDGRTDHLIGLVVSANSADIARIATAVTTGPLGIVAVNPVAAERLRRLLGFQIDVPMMTAGVREPDELDAMRGTVECVVCTQRADNENWERIAGVPFMHVRYQTDERSIEQVRIAIQRVGQSPEFALTSDTRAVR
ncbi:MAG TPA: GntR family transcriptional regulator [Thermomicrobiales bacterium]|nr:GntR family transcriptional regulator [Thermomicrobiales bacterium]